MKAVFYTDVLLQELYYFLEERTNSSTGPVISLVLFESDNRIEASYQSEKRYNNFTKLLKDQLLIRKKVDGRIYLDMDKILRWSFSDYKVRCYGVEFTNTNDGGIVTYHFCNSKEYILLDEDIQKNTDVYMVYAGSYIHARIKMYNEFSKSDRLKSMRDYGYIGNSEPVRFIKGCVSDR